MDSFSPNVLEKENEERLEQTVASLHRTMMTLSNPPLVADNNNTTVHHRLWQTYRTFV